MKNPRTILNRHRKNTKGVPPGMVSVDDAVAAMSEYLESAIPVEQLIFLRSSIHSADTSGEEVVIKDLRVQMDAILKKFGIKTEFKLIDPLEKHF